MDATDPGNITNFLPSWQEQSAPAAPKAMTVMDPARGGEYAGQDASDLAPATGVTDKDDTSGTQNGGGQPGEDGTPGKPGAGVGGSISIRAVKVVSGTPGIDTVTVSTP